MGSNVKEIEKTFDEVHASHKLQMDILGEHWRPKYPRIFGAPPILKYEAFSSWCVRVSGACNISIRHLLRALEINAQCFWIDAGRAPLDLQKIAGLVMCDINSLSHLNWPFDSVLADFDFSCLTVEILNQQPIYKYCPTCLASDSIPYFRQSWRLASTYICPIHKIILRDSCHHCKKRIDLSLGSPKSGSNRSARCLLFCTQCGASLGESPHKAIGRRFLSDVFFMQELIENQIRSTSSYWMPSQFSEHHESLWNQYPSKLISSVANAQIILKSIIEPYADPLNRSEIRKENRLELESLLHLKKYVYQPYTDQSNGIYIALDGPSIFKSLSPIVGLQISEYQSANGSTIWREETAGIHEDFHTIKTEDIHAGASWCTNSPR